MADFRNYVDKKFEENRQKVYDLQASHREALSESENALMVFLTLFGIEPRELTTTVDFHIEEAWERAEGWENRFAQLMTLASEAKKNQVAAENVARKFQVVSQWAPIPEQQLLDLTLPEFAPSTEQ